MNKKNKLFIDRVIGFTLCVLLRLPALFLEKILQRKHVMPPQDPPERIVVAKYLGIGSILQATPMLQGLKVKYPAAELIFISSKSNKDLLYHYDFIDDILCVDDTSILQIIITSVSVIAELVSRNVDLFLDLEVHSTYGSLMCFLSCSKNRLGFSVQDRDYKAFLYTHLLYLNTSFPIRYCYSQLGQLAGMDSLSSNEDLLSPTLTPTLIEQVNKKVEMIFNFEHEGIIVINPNASDLRYERRWSRESFANVAKYFAQKGYAVALVGAFPEHGYVQGIIELLGNDAERTRNVAGVFSLIEFFAFLRQCKLVITNDSGVMNMALTMPVPQLLLAGPVIPDQYFIPNEFRTYIYYQTYCSPCTHYMDIPPCAGDNICMQQINPKEVTELCERLLRGQSVEAKRNTFFSYRAEVLGVLKDKGRK